jgi:hypothetical protein
MKRRYRATACVALSIMIAGVALHAQVPASSRGTATSVQSGPETPATPGGRGGGRGGGQAVEPAALIFREAWTRAPQAQPILQANLGNQDLVLHTYGDGTNIRKTFHTTEDYTYTGETVTNWALTVSDPKNYWDLARDGKVMLRTRNSGMRVTRIVIKTADGKYFVSEEGSPDSNVWMDREYVLSNLKWWTLLVTDTPTNPITVRKPDPNRQPIVPQAPGQPDLSRVEEVGFTDLMPGGWIPSTSRVHSWALYGRKVAR